MPNEDYNANFEELMRINLLRILHAKNQSITSEEFLGLNNEPYIHKDELIRDLIDLHYIETESNDHVYYLTELGYNIAETYTVSTNEEEKKDSKSSRFWEFAIAVVGALVLLFAINMYWNNKYSMEDEKQPSQETMDETVPLIKEKSDSLIENHSSK